MSELNRIFGELKQHFARNTDWTYVEDCLAEYETEEETQKYARRFWSLPMCKQNLQEQDHQVQTLRELSNCIRSIRCVDIEQQSSYDTSYDNWAKFENISHKEYLAYIYGLASLASLSQDTLNGAKEPLNVHINLQLALNAVSTYFLTLTIPGAKSFGVFDEDVIEHCLKVFQLLEQNDSSGVRTNVIWILFVSICDDLKLLFRFVHFKDNQKPRDDIILCLVKIIYSHFEKGYKNACAIQLHSKCFELFEEIANEHNGNVTETLELIMNMTFHLHSIPECSKSGWPKSGDHISDWFIKLLEKYPDNVSEVVTTFIECLITNPIREWKTVDEKVAIGYAAKYDAALYAKCNKSCTDILKQTINALDAVGMQLRSLELMERILQLETHVEWSLFRHEVSTKPREVTLIAETILSLNDRTFSVRRKACQVLNNSLKQGSPITMRILQECLKFTQFADTTGPTERKLHLWRERPAQQQHSYSFEGHEELEPLVKTMPQIIYKLFLNSNNGLARCSGIALLERLILVNPLIMYDTSYERVFSHFSVDTLSSVRKSAMESVDTLLQTYPSCTILIDLYCRIWPCLLNDEDIALQKLALLSFNRNVLLNIRSLEYNEPKDRLPWLILATLLASQPRNYIQQRLTLLLQNENIVNLKLVNTIIPYLHSVAATEAWVLLVFLSSRITNNLDSLITIFNDLSSHNLKCNQLLALELITYCPRNFSKAALNQLFKRLYEALKSGSIWLALVSPAVHLLNVIDRLSNSNGPQDIIYVGDWNLQLFNDVQSSILECMDNFQDEHIRTASLLGTYTEILAKSPDQRANTQIVKFVLNYLQLYTKLNESNFDTDNERNLNWMVVIAGRFAIRDQNLAIKLSKMYGEILSKNDRPQLINSTLIAMNDLGKKYPIILENNMNCILIKLYSKFSTTRVRTYRCVKDVILAGNIKLKGPILISLLAGLVDDSPEVAREADAFFIRYKKLYDKMLFHHCLKECPFDFNDQAFLKGSTRLDARFKSPLKGEGMAKNRRLIYNHIIASLDETALLLYFGQLKLLAEKTKDKEFIRSPGALAVVVDILFIMRRICSCTKAKGQQGGAQTDGDAVDGDEPSAAAQQDQLAVAETTAPTRGRAKKGDPCEEPLKQLERCLRYVPDTFRNLKSVMNPALQQEFELFCTALTLRFSNYTDFAQPAEFWEKYKLNRMNKAKAKPKTKRSRRKEADSELANETEDSMPFSSADKDSDSEMPLDRHTLANTTQGGQKRTGGFDVLATELIFQQHDW